MKEPKTTQVAFRLPSELVEKIDSYAGTISSELNFILNRTDACQRLVNIGLDTEYRRFELMAKAKELKYEMAKYGFDDEIEFRKWDIASNLAIRDRGILFNSAEWNDQKQLMALSESRKALLAKYYPD